MAASMVSFRAPDPLATEIASRTPAGYSHHEMARRDLDRYYTILALSRAHLRETFDRAELCLILDANNGTLWESWSLALLWANVADGIAQDDLHEKWGVGDPDDLVRRLRALSPGHACALVDACERFWQRAGEDTDVVLRDLGLLREDGQR